MNRQILTIPNLMTCGNLLCGCLGIMSVFIGTDLVLASFLIFIACILDFLDGFVARALKSASPIGKELDSLADMVTFGVLPAFMLGKLLIAKEGWIAYSALPLPNSFGSLWTNYNWDAIYLMIIPLLLAIFSALRLAKFNVDTRQSDSFIGVPTPANAIVVASFPLILEFNSEYAHIITNPYFLIGYTLVMSYLLISEIPLFALKFKSFKWADNQIKYIFLMLSVLLLVFLKFLAIPIVVLLYIVLSVVNNFLVKKT